LPDGGEKRGRRTHLNKEGWAVKGDVLCWFVAPGGPGGHKNSQESALPTFPLSEKKEEETHFFLQRNSFFGQKGEKRTARERK